MVVEHYVTIVVTLWNSIYQLHLLAGSAVLYLLVVIGQNLYQATILADPETESD